MLLAGIAQAQTFDKFLHQLEAGKDSLSKSKLIDEYLAHHDIPVVEGTTIHFVYRGNARLVAVPSEINWWNPASAPMEHVLGTNLFFHNDTIPLNGRMEYKLRIDSSWVLDSLNKHKALGGFGYNSDVWMPEYRPAKDYEAQEDIPHGRIDTLKVQSAILHRTHALYVYVPSVEERMKDLPVIYATDGNDYLAFSGIQNILDISIALHRIRPVIVVFIDPRANPEDNSTNMRMADYAASDAFLDFLEKEVTPFVEIKYPVAKKAEERLIMGVSMGGLISTYAVLQRPGFILNCAAQSPSYVQADSAVMKLLRKIHKVNANIYMDTGTLNDTQVEARLVKKMLEDKGARLMYSEYPEGHNWTNWRARLGKILGHFFADH